jgi:hypothetical protein
MIGSKIRVLMVASVLIGVVAATNIQQASAPRSCGGCLAFKKLTHEFEKNVISAVKNGDSGLIPELLEQYNEDVRAIDFSAPKLSK